MPTRLIWKSIWLGTVISLVTLAVLTPPAGLSHEAGRQAWQVADLRLLDPVDAPQPSQDLVAVFARQHNQRLQFRLDLLDFTPELDYDLYLALDLAEGGITALPVAGRADFGWEVLLAIPAQGSLQAVDSGGLALSRLKLRVQRDPIQDTIILSLDPLALPSGSRVSQAQVFVTPAGTDQVSDRSAPLLIHGPTLQPARVALVFWNTFPAYSPAQALRRWDGAHSGPHSERHGLRGLLDAVSATGVPVTLLDIKTPASLTALDSVGGIQPLRRLVQQGLVYVPDTLPVTSELEIYPFQPSEWALAEIRQQGQEIAQSFGLATSDTFYSPSLSMAVSGDYRLVLRGGTLDGLPLEHPTLEASPASWIIRMPPPDTWPQVTYEGASLELRQALANAAYAAATGPAQEVLVIGGDLPRTLWGNPQAARQTLAYLAAHPWLQVIPGTELPILLSPPERLPAGSPSAGADFTPYTPQGLPQASGLTAAQVQERVLEGLRSAPAGEVRDLAWQAYAALLAPIYPETPALGRLRANYLGQIGHLLAGAKWSAGRGLNPCQEAGIRAAETGSPCSAVVDLDWDGTDEVVLASENFFAVFETEGAYLTLALARDRGAVHMLAGGSNLFITGLSDPSVWEPERGVAGDPAQLRGALSDFRAGRYHPLWIPYSVELEPGAVVFSSPDSPVRKTVRLEQGRLVAEYTTSEEIRVQMPLALDPWQRFQPGWNRHYTLANGEQYMVWTYAGDLGVEVRTNGSLTAQDFNASSEVIRQPENPDYPYPPGHFLPFPLALGEIKGSGQFWVELRFTSPR